jgi:hypothetical protein
MAAAAVVLASTLSAHVLGQARGHGSTQTARFISPTVVASWNEHWRASDGATTTLLVLWRGSPGWFFKSGAHGASGGGGGTSGNDWQSFSYGGLTFDLAYDFDRQIVTILKQDVSFKDTNVVLVDAVDGSTGGRIVGQLRVDVPPAPAGDPAPDPIARIIKTSPVLYEYLQCGIPAPMPPSTPPAMQTYIDDVMTTLCAQARP